MPTVLKFIDGEFVESESNDYDAKLELIPDGHNGFAKLYFSDGASLITRRTATRQAHSICATGFVLKNGVRVGRGYELEILDDDDVHDALRKEAHKYNKS